MILYAGKSKAKEIELLGLNESDIRVAEFITEELPKEVLANKFHDAIRRAREQLVTRTDPKQISQDP